MSAPGPIRITLVSIHPNRSPQSVPLANSFLAASLKSAPDLSGKVNVTVIDLYNEQSPQECSKAVIATDPNMVGFSVYIWNREHAVATATLLKVAKPDLILFCGGPEATADRNRLLLEAPWDFLIHGEGEAPLSAAVRAFAAGNGVTGTHGTAVLQHGSFSSFPADETIDLEKIPSPFLAGVIDPAKYTGMLWQISRGCSFACDFCFDAGGSRKVRRFSIKRLEDELKWFVKNEVSQVIVLDSTFNSDKERAVRILKLIRKIAPHIHFHFEVRSEFIDAEQAQLFASITCSLQIGLQSADSSVLKNVGRSFDRADFTVRMNLLNETGAIFGLDLIYGLPGDMLKGFRQSLDFALGLYPNHLDIFPLALLPGTRLAARSKALGLKHQTEAPYLMTATPGFPEEDMSSAGDLAAACDIFYSRGKAVSWFMSILNPLKMKPSRFLELFYGYLVKQGITPEDWAGLSDEGILELQCGFVKELFAENRLKKLQPVALDLIIYNYHYAAALMAVPPEIPDELNPDLSGLCLSLAGSAELATFNYEILELLEAGHADLKTLAAALSPDGSYAVIYPKNGEVRTESIDHSYYRLLEMLDAKRSAGEIANKLSILPDDSASFLSFALAEGIVVVAA
jgi:radical SAM superfamily enzyme YgiQ (UPF0313 family)